MAKLYARKIINKEINAMTGEVWVIADVPERWTAEVQDILDGSIE